MQRYTVSVSLLVDVEWDTYGTNYAPEESKGADHLSCLEQVSVAWTSDRPAYIVLLQHHRHGIRTNQVTQVESGCEPALTRSDHIIDSNSHIAPS